jgi:murein L,D-transpeptidase YcbB/YkuD
MRIEERRIARTLASAGLSALAVTTVLGLVATPALGTPPEISATSVAAPAVPAALWSAEALSALQIEVMAAAGEGLDPGAYDLAALKGRAPGIETDRIANAIALALADDYSRGRVDDPSRLSWHIARRAGPDALASGLRAALAANRVAAWLRGLLPQDSRYAALRSAYASAQDDATRDRLRANMERWRWMPRDLGKDHIYVNVPSYTLAVVDEGKPVSTYTVVVGAPKTPTPQIAVDARSVVVNPWWNVPRSIAGSIKPGAGKGYVFSGGSVRQKPGPGNALGRVKIDMPNPHAIYLHDTPSKALFAKESRAFSHGCIRVKDIDKLAAELLELDRGDSSEVSRALAQAGTRTVALQRTRPVYLVYFTADVGADGQLVTYEDPYGRDAKLLASLDRHTRLAAKSIPGGTRSGS